MKKWKIILLIAVAMLLLSPTLKTALNNLTAIFLMMVVIRFLIRFYQSFLNAAAILFRYTRYNWLYINM